MPQIDDQPCKLLLEIFEHARRLNGGGSSFHHDLAEAVGRKRFEVTFMLKLPELRSY